MSSNVRTANDDTGLRADALGFGESVVMGVAGIGPAYSLAATAAVLIGSVGVLAPASLLYCDFLAGDWFLYRLVGDHRFGLVYGLRHPSCCFGDAKAV